MKFKDSVETCSFLRVLVALFPVQARRRKEGGGGGTYKEHN